MKQPQTITTSLHTDEALVLQSIYENIETSAKSLARQLGMSRRRVINLIGSLQKKHLVAIKRSYEDLWVNVSKKGRETMRYIWPEFVVAS